MTTPIQPATSTLDFTAADRWPTRAAAHVLGAGLVVAVLAALPVAPSDLDRHQLPKETLVHIATWLAVLLARPIPPRGLRPAALFALTALVTITVLSGGLAGNGWLAMRAGSLILTGVAAFVTARHLAARGMASVLLAWCGLAGVAGVATGLAQAYGAQSSLFAATRVPGGTFGNRNFMAHFAAITLPIVMYTALSTRRRRVLGAASLACAVLVAAIVLTRSRAAWLGSSAGLLVLAGVSARAWRRNALPAVAMRAAILSAAVGGAAVAAIAIPNALAWRSSSPYIDTFTGLAKSDEGSGHGRLLQYGNTVRLALKHPVLGVGPGNWPVRYAEVAPSNDPTWVFGDVVPINPWPSSDWMALLSELGIGAVIAALLLGAAVAWRGWQAGKASGDRVVAGAALLAMLVTTFIEGNLDAVLLLPAPLLLISIGAGALLQQCDQTVSADSASPASPSRAYLVVSIVLGVVTLRSVLQTTAYVIAGSGRSTSRLVWAARIDPGSFPIRIALALRLTCADAKGDVLAVVRMAPNWPATREAARRCGVRTR